MTTETWIWNLNSNLRSGIHVTPGTDTKSWKKNWSGKTLWGSVTSGPDMKAVKLWSYWFIFSLMFFFMCIWYIWNVCYDPEVWPFSMSLCTCSNLFCACVVDVFSLPLSAVVPVSDGLQVSLADGLSRWLTVWVCRLFEGTWMVPTSKHVASFLLLLQAPLSPLQPNCQSVCFSVKCISDVTAQVR